MKSRMLKTLFVCLCFACCVVAAQAQGHPGGQPPGGHPPGPPPGGAPPNSGGGTNGSGSGSGHGAAPNAAQAPNLTAASGVKLGPPGRWWDDKSTAQSLGLRRDQQKKMDAIVDANRSALVDCYKTFEKQKSALDTLSKNPNADKAKLFAAIDAVNQARASLQKANTEMLLQIRAQLDAEQMSKLEKLP